MGRPVTIRRSLLTNLIVVVLAFGLALLATTFVGRRGAMLRFAQSLTDQTLSLTEEQLRGFFGPVERELQTLGGWVQTGRIDGLEDPALDDLLGGFLRQHPWVRGAILAGENGDEHLLVRDGERWQSRDIADPAKGSAVVSEWTDADPRRRGSTEVLDYDPRSRPWYRGAVEGAGEVHWTRPYVFYSAQAPGITASRAVYTPRGELRVIGLDVLLIDVSRFTSELRVPGSGAAFVLDEEGRIVGMPRGPRFPDDAALAAALLRRPAELDAPVARDMAAALLDGDAPLDRGRRFISEGGAWWGQLRRFELSPERHLWIGVAVPESELLAGVAQQRIWIVLLTLVVIGVAVGRAAALAGRYGRPVEALVRESERIATGDLESGPAIETRVAEVRRLAAAHDRMREGLRTLLRIEHDLQIARRIQQSTFPRRLPSLEGFDLAGWSEPAEETGGDTYDVIGIRHAADGTPELTDGPADEAVLLLADATGHGIGPALSVLQVRAMLRTAVRMVLDLSPIATHLNERLCADLPSGRFITCWLGRLDAAGSTLTAVSAGQGPLLLYRAASDDFEVRQGDTTPFGLFEHERIEVPPPIRLQPGDLFAAISDGIFEAADGSGEEFGAERVRQVIRERRGASAAEIAAAIREAQERFCAGVPPADDRTVVLLKKL